MLRIQLVVFLFLIGDIIGRKVYIRLRHQENFAVDELQLEQEYIRLKPESKLQQELTEFFESQKSQSKTTPKPENGSKSNLEKVHENTIPHSSEKPNTSYPNIVNADEKTISSNISKESQSNNSYLNEINEESWDATFAERAKQMKDYLSKKYHVINGYLYDKDNASLTEYKYPKINPKYLGGNHDIGTTHGNPADYIFNGENFDETLSDTDYDRNTNQDDIRHLSETEERKSQYSTLSDRFKRIREYVSQKMKKVVYPAEKNKEKQHKVNSLSRKAEDVQNEMNLESLVKGHPVSRQKRSKKYVNANEGWKLHYSTTKKPKSGKDGFKIEEKDIREAEKRKINIILGSIFGTLGVVLFTLLLVYCFVKDPKTFCIAFATGCPCIIFLCPCIARWIEKWLDPSKVVQEKMNIFMPGVIIHEDGKIEHYKPSPEEMECVIDIIEEIVG